MQPIAQTRAAARVGGGAVSIPVSTDIEHFR